MTRPICPKNKAFLVKLCKFSRFSNRQCWQVCNLRSKKVVGNVDKFVSLLHYCLEYASTDQVDGQTITHVSCVREVWSSILYRTNLTQNSKRFAVASTLTQVAVLPWRYDAQMRSWAPLTRSTLRRNRA